MIRRTAMALAVIWGGLWSGAAQAVDCRDIGFEGLAYTICEVDPATENLRLFLRDGSGEVYGSFGALEAAFPGTTLSFAMNAGMYHPDRRPVGHYLEDSREEMRLLTSASTGNFGLLPNGVLCIGDTSAQVYETLAFQAESPACRDATQSGPMLVIDGALHPRFLPNSASRYIRNGVGTSADGTRAVFAISQQAVSFHEFGRLFRDGLGLPQALYFDGNVSRLHAPQLGRSDGGFAMGPIVGVLE